MRYTIRQRILDYLASVNTPIQQYQIAEGIQVPASSVRREVQRLRKDGLVVDQDHFGWAYGGSAPRLVLARSTAEPVQDYAVNTTSGEVIVDPSTAPIW